MSGIAITFPSSPVEGQSYLAQNGFTYIYDSQKNRWKRGGEFVRAPRVLSYAGVAATTTGSGITTGPNGALIYRVPGFLVPSSDVGVDSYKAYRYTDSYPNYTEIQVSISSAFSTIAYAATSTSTTFSIPAGTLSGDTTYYVRARQFVGSNASAASTGAISGYSQNIVSFATTSLFLDAPTIVSIAGSTRFPVYQIGFAGTTLPATVTYTGSGLGNLQQVEWRVTGPRNPDSTGDTALAEVGIGTFSSATLANALVLAMPFSGATGVGITNDVNNAIRTASGASAGTTKTVTANGGIGTASVGIATTTAHFYPSAAFFDGSNDYLSSTNADYGFSTGTPFTIEGWFYPLTLPSSGDGSGGAIFGNRTSTESTAFTVYIGSSSTNTIGLHIGGGVAGYFSVPGGLSINNWYHFTLVRNTSNIVSFFVNGVLVGTLSPSADLSTGEMRIGCWGNGSGAFFRGYIQDFKIYKGLAKYQENFTPPLPTYGTISYTTRTIGSVGVATTAFFESTGDIPTAEASSTAANALVLAMPMNRTFGFQDINVAVRGLTSGASAGTAKTVGLGTTSTANAPSHPRISSTESKWYDGAAYFDGEDYVTITNSSDVSFGTGDFTVEGWCYRTGNSNYAPLLEIGNHAPSTGILFMAADATASNVARIYSGGFFGTSNILPLNQWYHLAFVRSSGNLLIYVDGVLQSSTAFTNNLTDSTTLYISNTASYAYRYTGYFQDIKVYKGFAKYTANFTPPRPICGFTTDLAIQTGFTTTSATGALLSSVVGLGSTSTLSFGADQNLVGVTSITSSSGITTLPDPYAQNLVLALPLANITGVGNSFTNDRNTQIRSASITGAGVTAGVTNTVNVSSDVSLGSTTKWYNGSAYFSAATSGAGLTVAYSSDFALESGDFTVEFWVRRQNTGDTVFFNTSTDGGSNGVIIMILNFGNTIYFTSGGTGMTNTTVNVPSSLLVVGEWCHLAAVKRSGVLNLYINGSLSGSTTSTSTTTGNKVEIGQSIHHGDQPKYMQDLRVYKGVAKYTTNFTPPPPMFGDYIRSTPNKIVFTPGSDYTLEARNTATGGIVTSTYSATRQWGTKPKGGIYDTFASNLILAIPGGAVGGATTTFDVTGQIRFETPTATYVNAGIVTYSNSLGIGTYQNKTVSNDGPVTISGSVSKYYSRSMYFDGGTNTRIYADGYTGYDWTRPFTVEFWVYFVAYTTSSYCTFFGNERAGVPNTFGITRNGSNLYVGSIDGGSLDANRWYHVAYCQTNTGQLLFKDGILVAQSSSKLGTITDYQYVISGARIVSDGFTGRAQFYLQDLRMYSNVAKYTSNFTPPNQIFLT